MGLCRVGTCSGSQAEEEPGHEPDPSGGYRPSLHMRKEGEAGLWPWAPAVSPSRLSQPKLVMVERKKLVATPCRALWKWVSLMQFAHCPPHPVPPILPASFLPLSASFLSNLSWHPFLSLFIPFSYLSSQHSLLACPSFSLSETQ